jgi:hypothetical protein
MSQTHPENIVAETLRLITLVETRIYMDGFAV